MQDSMKVKVIRPFRNPLTNRMAKAGDTFNVPLHRFWFSREKEGDIERVAAKAAKAAPQPKKKSTTEKGSK